MTHSLDKSGSLFYRRVDDMMKMSSAGKDLLFGAVHQENFAKNHMILHEGQICHQLYFVESGCLRTFYNKDGREINLNFALENNFTTDLKSLRGASPSEVCIQAMEPTTAWVFDKEALFQLYEQSGEITAFGRLLLEQLLFEEQEHANIFKIRTPTERYRYLEVKRPQLLQRVSLSQLASYLGISRETISRIRNKRQ